VPPSTLLPHARTSRAHAAHYDHAHPPCAAPVRTPRFALETQATAPGRPNPRCAAGVLAADVYTGIPGALGTANSTMVGFTKQSDGDKARFDTVKMELVALPTGMHRRARWPTPSGQALPLAKVTPGSKGGLVALARPSPLERRCLDTRVAAVCMGGLPGHRTRAFCPGGAQPCHNASSLLTPSGCARRPQATRVTRMRHDQGA